MKKKHLIITCEHAVDTIPEAYQALFKNDLPLLNTHRAIDFGALQIAKDFSQFFQCPLTHTTVSRLIIDCCRSLTHSECFSEFTKSLSHAEKEKLIRQYYMPYRSEVESYIRNCIRNHCQVIHLSMHSFTPVLHGHVRNTEIGFLYDPRRVHEKQLSTQWKQHILNEETRYRIRMNYPYRGVADGFTTWFRKHHSQEEYVGIEVEVNQALSRDELALKHLSQTLISSFSKMELVD